MQWRIDSVTINDGSPAVIDADGEYTLETRAVDAAGNETAWRSDTVRVDVTSPVNDTPAAPTDWRATDYIVHVEGSDGDGSGVADVEVKVDGGPISTDPDVRDHRRRRAHARDPHRRQRRPPPLTGAPRRSRSTAPTRPSDALTCPTGWSSHAVSCTATADGGLSGIADLEASVDGGAFAAVTANAVPVSTNGGHRRAQGRRRRRQRGDLRRRAREGRPHAARAPR